jgi:hypothetical protein
MRILLRYNFSIWNGKECDEEINGNRDKRFTENIEIHTVDILF